MVTCILDCPARIILEYKLEFYDRFWQNIFLEYSREVYDDNLELRILENSSSGKTTGWLNNSRIIENSREFNVYSDVFPRVSTEFFLVFIISICFLNERNGLES